MIVGSQKSVFNLWNLNYYRKGPDENHSWQNDRFMALFNITVYCLTWSNKLRIIIKNTLKKLLYYNLMLHFEADFL